MNEEQTPMPRLLNYSSRPLPYGIHIEARRNGISMSDGDVFNIRERIMI